MPIAYVGLVGLRCTRMPLLMAGAIFAAVATAAGVVLLQMNHVSASILIVLGVVGAVEAGALFARHERRAGSR